MDFKQIEAFANVVRYKSFSKAADALFLTQPTISTHVSTLEKELGIRLIDRHGKEALPTMQGTILYQYATQMLNIREKALFSLDSFTNEIDGMLEIHASAIAGEYLVPSLAARFRSKYPSVRFSLEQSESAKVEESILSQKGEIGFLCHRGTANLNYEKLVTDPMVLITPKSEKFQNLFGRELGIEQFIEEPFLWRAQNSAVKKEFEEKAAMMDYNPKQINIVATSNSAEAIKQAVGQGLGVSIMPRMSVEKTQAERTYLTFPIKDMDLDSEFYLVWNKNTALSPTAETFKNFVVESFQA
jgi:LysR family transcriptional regulator, transcriptional activator of the cysJI operon